MSNVILEKLNAELEFNPMGNHRKFKFVLEHLEDKDKAIKFFINELGYKRWEVNQIVYHISYHKRLYQQQKLIAAH